MALDDGIFIAIHSPGHGESRWEKTLYIAGAIYAIDDSHPVVFISFNQNLKTLPDNITKPSIREIPDSVRADSNDRTWWRWTPLGHPKDTGRERRYGHWTIEVSNPKLKFQCYIFPGLFFTRQAYRRLLDETEETFGVPLEWDQRSHPTRVAVMKQRGRPSIPERIETIRSEMNAVEVLERIGILQAESQVTAEQSTEEERLLSLWSFRRLQDLAAMQQELLQGAMNGSDLNQRRIERRSEVKDQRQKDEDAARLLIARIGRVWERRRHDLGVFSLTPTMQRDHRLRRLMQAFSPEVRESWATDERAARSTSPPLKAPDTFELWGAARLVRAACALGWNLERLDIITGMEENGISRASFRFHRDGYSLSLEYKPDIDTRLGQEQPGMHVRRRPLLEVVASHLPEETDRLISTDDLEPDYCIKMAFPEGEAFAFAIGDATLSDPRRAGKREDAVHEKVNKVEKYQRRIVWRRHRQTIECSCTFVVLPGPHLKWRDAANMNGYDSVLLFPDPEIEVDLDMRDRLKSVLEIMISSVASVQVNRGTLPESA
ncbi:MAG: hypothetical protein IPI49_16125 [Myxococcales bacterium]|nr:hypothetical protein [Myxococcales bacterium]